MSILTGCERIKIPSFGGARPLLDPLNLRPQDAVQALNCDFSRKTLQPRRGFTSVGSAGAATNTSLRYFLIETATAQKRYVAVGTTTGVQLYNIDTTAIDLNASFASGTNAIVFAPYGNQLYACAVTTSGLGSNQSGFVWDSTSNFSDSTFRAPLTTGDVGVVLSNTGSGVIDAGVHDVGFIFQTKSGYWTAPGPTGTGGYPSPLVPQAVTASGGQQLQAVLTPTTTWPTDIVACQVIYTTVLNNFQYYLVPGTITSISSGSATPVTITWNISDAQLRSIGSQGAGTLADDYFALISAQSANGNAGNLPFYTKFVLQWGPRLVWVVNYGGTDGFFISEPNNPQWISATQHFLQLPGQLPISTAFVLRGLLYFVSPSGGIFAYTDNGGRPIYFSPPFVADHVIGTPAPFGVTTDETGNGYALIAAPQGLYVFNGFTMPELPISYYATPDWEQIDWSKPTQVFVKDHTQDRKFIVQATLLSGSPAIFSFDYTLGRTLEQVNYSQWTISGTQPQAIELVQLSHTGNWGLWYTGGASLFRQMSVKDGDALASLYADSGSGYNFSWLGGPLPGHNFSQMFQHLALRFRGLSLQAGGANLYITVQSLDGTHTLVPPGNPVSLSQLQDKHILVLYDFQNEQAAYQFSNNSVANNAPMISTAEHYYGLLSEQR